jgi:arsenate reductase
MTTVLFACVHNAGRSQMAAALFNQIADPARALAISAGTDPGTRVQPEVVHVMTEVGIDLASGSPQRLSDDMIRQAQWLITMGCDDRCLFVPGAHVEDWPLPDPHGRSLHEVRIIRDEISRRVADLIDREAWR